MNRYPYDEELRKTPLNPEMIRYEVRKNARHGLVFGVFASLFMTVGCGCSLALFISFYPWHAGTLSLIFGLLLAAAFSAGMVSGVLLLASAVRNHRRATRGEIVIEADTVTYIEHDRPRRNYTRKYIRVVYEDFLHFKSGRELRDIGQKYRHMDIDGETFIVAVYAADPQTILLAFRLSDYNWQA